MSEAPDPVARVPQAEPAGRGQRLGAVLVDGVIGIPLALLALEYTDTLQPLLQQRPVTLEQQLLLAAFGWASFIAIHSYTLVKRGQTIGKYLIGVRIADLEGGVPPLWRIAVLRYLPFNVLTLFGLLGSLVLLLDPLMICRGDRRCLHDLFCGTRVLRA